MNYVLERGSIASLPVLMPSRALRLKMLLRNVTESQINNLTAQYKHETCQPFSSRWLFSQIGNTRMQAGELFGAITKIEDYETLTLLLIGSKITADKLIRNWT